MRKHFLAIVAIVLVLAATACTQYPDNWMDYFPQDPETKITTIEDLLLFVSGNESGKAKLDITIDPNDPDFDNYFPMTIRGTKVLSGEIEVSEIHRFPIFYSSTATPPCSVLTRAASGINLFEIADEAGTNVVVSNLTATISEEAEEKISTVIYIDTTKGSLTTNNFTVNTSNASSAAEPVIGISIGSITPAANITISNSNPGKIDIAKDNEESDDILQNITDNNTDIPQEDISTRFDATTQEEFSAALVKYDQVRLTQDIIIDSNQISVNDDSYNNENNRDALDFIGDYIIDLNGHMLTSTVLWDIEDNSSMEILNGNLVINPAGTTAPSLCMFEEAKLKIQNVVYTSSSDCILLVNNNDGMTLDIIDSTLYSNTSEGYAISTNASAPNVSQDIIINIINSSITLDGTSSALLLNVMTDVTITDSTITGGWQALIARGGEFLISGSNIISTGKADVEDWQYLFSPEADFPADMQGYDDWGSGNAVAYAALVIGNATKDSYVYPTTVELYDSTVSMTINEGNALAKDIFIASANNQDVTFITDDSEAIQTIIDYGEYSAWRGDTCYVQLEGGNKIHLESEVTEP